MSKATKQIKNVDAMLSSDSDEEVQTTKKTTTQAKATKAPVKATKKDSDDESSDSEIELLKTKAKRPVEAKKEQAKTALPKAQAKVTKKQETSDEESSEEEVKPAKKTVAAVKAAPKKVASDSDEESSEEEVKPAAKTVAKAAPKKVASDSDEESSEEEIVTVPKVVAKPAQVANSGCMELFVKNLSWNTDENLLGSFFGNYGTVNNVKVLYDKNTGKARGLAFVEFSTREEAQAALDDASNLNIDGRLVQVSFSDQKPERPAQSANTWQDRGNSSNRGGNSYGGDRPQRSNFQGERHTAFVGNLGFKTDENSVKRFFADCGSVVDVRIAKNEEGRSKGFCHVDFESPDAVEKAKAKAGQDLDGREIRVDASTPRQGGGDRGGRGRGGFGGGRGGFGGRGGRGGNSNPMDRAKRTGGFVSTPGAVKTFSDDE